MSELSNAEQESRRSRTRRRETMLNAVATILGCLSLVIMIATVLRVVMMKLGESAKVNPEYIKTVYDGMKKSAPSSKMLTVSQPALEDVPSSVQRQRTQPAAGESVPAAWITPQVEEASPSKRDSTLNLGATGATSSLEEGIVSGIRDIESKRSRIEATLKGFFEATTLERKLSYVRDPERVRPMMEHFQEQLEGHSSSMSGWRGLGWLLSMDEPGFRLGYAQAIFAEVDPVTVIIEEEEDGSFRVDWESSVRYGELNWGEFIETKPTAPKLFRVIASRPRGSPLTGAPAGSEVLEIKHPDDQNIIYAYFDRQDPKFRSLIQQLQTGHWKDVPLTLRLCYAGPAPNGGESVRIADVEGKGWLILQGTRS